MYRKNSERKDLNELLKGLNIRCNSLIDIGGSDGQITEEIAEYFNIPDMNVLIVDPITISSKYKTCTPDNLLLSFKSGDELLEMAVEREGLRGTVGSPVDLITCMMSIHHLNENLHEIIRGVFNNLKINGYLLIKEHDVINSNDVLFLNRIHDIYSKYKNGDANTVNATYYSKDELNKYLTSIGFRLVRTYSREGYNPQKKYHSLYRKISIKFKESKLPEIIHSDTTASLTLFQEDYLKKLVSHYE